MLYIYIYNIKGEGEEDGKRECGREGGRAGGKERENRRMLEN